MGLAVVTVASGGLPVVETTFGMPVTEATNGRGLAVTKVVGKPGLPVTFETPSVPVLTVFATFNGTPVSSVTVSNGGLTVTHGAGGSAIGVCSQIGFSSGKYYYEMTIQVSTSSVDGIGVAPFTGGVFVDPTGNAIGGVGLSLSSANVVILTNGVDTTKRLGATAVGDVYGFAIDFTAKLAWIRKNGGNWNGDAAANPATGVGGVTVPAGTLKPYVRFAAGGATNVMTGNFGQSAFASSVPSGFSLGWGT